MNEWQQGHKDKDPAIQRQKKNKQAEFQMGEKVEEKEKDEQMAVTKELVRATEN